MARNAFSTGGGGGGLHFRSVADVFTGANLGACRTARDAYFVAVAARIVEFQSNEFLAIMLNPANSTDNVFETYLPGNIGSTYASGQWAERTSAIQGNRGLKGDTGTAIDQTARSVGGAAAIAAASAQAALNAEVLARIAADTALGARVTAIPGGGGGGGGGGVSGTPFSPTLIFTADDVDLPNDQTTVAITLTTAWDSFDAFYFSVSLRNADAINNLILKEDFQRVGVKAAAGTNWYTGTEPQAIFVLDQNIASGGVAGIAICRIADTTMLLLARSFSSSSVNAQDLRIWGLNFGGLGEKGDKGDPGSGTADLTARASIAAEITARDDADTAEAIERDRVDVLLGGRITNNTTEVADVKVIAEAAQTVTEVAASIGIEARARGSADSTLGGRVDSTNIEVAAVKVTAEAALTEAETDARIALATYSGLADTPSAIVADKFLKTNAAGDAVEYVDEPGVDELAAEVDARTKADTAANVIANQNAAAGTQETLTRIEADRALNVRFDTLSMGGGGGRVLKDKNQTFNSANILAIFDDAVEVPSTGLLRFEVHSTSAAYAGSFTIPTVEFLTKSGNVSSNANQGANFGFSFSTGQNKAFHVSHRTFSNANRFLVGSSQTGEFSITITHISGNGLADGSVAEDQLVAGVVAKLNSVPEYAPGPTPNIFSGTNRTAAIAALDMHLDGVSVVTQASTRIYSDADNYITVSVNASEGIGPKGNKWIMKWGGDSDSAGEIELDTADSLFQAVLKWDVDVTTLAGLHAEFSGDSKFSSVVTGNDALIASVIETFGEDTVGNTIFFQGGNRVHMDTAHDWFTHYVDNLAATVTLEYQSRQEMQVWDPTLIDFRTVFILLDSPTEPNPFTVLAHDDSSPEDWQWTAVAGTAETELVARTAGTVINPTRGSINPVVPLTSEEIWVRLSKGGDDINMRKLDKLVLPSGDDAELRVELRLGVSGIHLRIGTDGHIHVKRTTSVSGNVTIGCDIWYR